MFVIYFQHQSNYQTVTNHRWYWNEEREPYHMKKLGSVFSFTFRELGCPGIYLCLVIPSLELCCLWLANARDMRLTCGLRRLHKLQSHKSWAREPHLRKPACSRARALQQGCHCTEKPQQSREEQPLLAAARPPSNEDPGRRKIDTFFFFKPETTGVNA